MGLLTSESVKTEVKADCNFQDGECLEPVNNECPQHEFYYETIANTDCDKKGLICCVIE